MNRVTPLQYSKLGNGEKGLHDRIEASPGERSDPMRMYLLCCRKSVVVFVGW